MVLTPGMGATRTVRAMQRLGAAEQMFGLALTELEGLQMPAESARFVFEGKARKAAEAEVQRAF